MPHNASRRVRREEGTLNCHEAELEEASEPAKKKRKASLTGYESDSSNDDNSDVEFTPKKERLDASDDVAQKDYKSNFDATNSFDAPIHDKNFDHDHYEEVVDNSPETHLPEDGDIKVEAFNVEEEREKGYFDEAGNYIQEDEDDEDAIQDQDLWINDVKDVQKAAASQKRAENSRRIENRKLHQSSRHFMINEALLRFRFFLFHEGTVLDSLAELNKRRGAGGPNVLNSINYLSDLTGILELKGVEDVYSLKRADVVSLYAEECLDDSALLDDYKTPVWAFKWLNKPPHVHGPYTNYQMQYWKQSYFQNRVAVRFYDDPDEPGNWLDLNSLTFM